MRRALIVTATVLTALLVTVLPIEAQPAPTTTVQSATTAPVDWPAVIRRQHNERAFWAEIIRQQRAAQAWSRLLAYLAARQCRGYGCVQGIRVCDAWPGDFPCKIINRESHFDPRARNPRSTAGGLAQMLNGTFGSICPADRARYGNAANAPVSVQVRCYRALWAGGRGASHWRL